MASLVCKKIYISDSRQGQLAKMTSDLCEDGGVKQREKETPGASKASSVSSLELPGPWNIPLSPVTPEHHTHVANQLLPLVLPAGRVRCGPPG